MKWSSLDKAQYANIASIVLFAIALGVELYKYGFEVIRLLNITNFLLAWIIFANIKHAKNTIHRIAVLLDEASKGRLEDRVVLLKDKGELKTMARNLNYFLDVVETFLREIKVPIEYASQGRFFRAVVDTGFPGMFKKTAQALKTPLHDMKEDFELKKRISLNAQLGQLGGGIAASLEVVYRDLLKSVERSKGIAQESEKTSGLAQNGVDILRKVSGSFVKVVSNVEEEAKSISQLADKAKNVVGIIELIREVAEQTNLLALNAAIEAARAGEQGRGFAVVADEVRRLAERTQKATEEVAQILTTVQEEVQTILEKSKNAVKSVKESSQEVDSLRSIIDSFNKSAGNTARLASLIENILDITANKLDIIIFKHNAYFCLYNLVDTGFYSDSRSCTFGQWFYKEGMSKFGQHEEFKNIEALHEKLHAHVEEILEIFKAEDPESELIRREKEVLKKAEEMEKVVSNMFSYFDKLIEKLERR
ncbi:MAG: methyl-accepting chemotaxis protein [Aquificaceae bacterium]|nr:methyl-accepting chemotaxis protein [Aquificaceae bacterium]